ncbi:DUF3189 family protein [Desulfallas sp. Bu1-1]|uniref:DUF3189 family protein n=1 Tax=Desulfallas sp. Bu1-1 TaxID=2787620 RepID=UPI00189E1202|nr:DUF3189 family protein [Desulfallas sp. Bu1-1]MBF7082013.1 DUF3189 family protein [Desulfallas sp. Bu1-1]
MKRVIYYNDTGFPFAVLAAAIRSGRLPADRPPGRGEVKEVLLCYGLGGGDASVYDLGRGSGDEKCLALWTKGNGDMVTRAINSFLGLFHIHDYELVRLNCRRTPLLGLGVWLSRFPGLKAAGYSLIHRCVANVYRELAEAARRGTEP